ncbi:MAG: hypothetical protein J6O49_17870 [Bacteroidaceae bacterium]|nr:hypothetical protein [Bacteroidaceae bacterium]
MKTSDVYIRSIDKRISLNEFKKHTYKEGHVYKINDGNFQKCVGYKGYTPLVESLCLIINANGGHTQIIRNPNQLPIPSLDFVNKVLCGEITEVDPDVYDSMIIGIYNFGMSVKATLNSELCKVK